MKSLLLICSSFVVASVLIVPETTHAEEKATVDQLKFAIYEFDVRGNTLLEQADIERVLYPFMGTAKRFDDVEAARQALEQFYREKGYPTVLVNIPEQNASRGTISLDVVESRIASVVISGSSYFSPKDIREQVPALKEGAIFSMPAVRQQLGVLNSANPDRSITPVLRAGKLPGTVEVELKVKDKVPAHAKLELNNKYSAYTTHQRAIASLNYGNLWQLNHSVGLDYQWTPQDTSEVKVLVAKYIAPVNALNDKLILYFVDSKSKVRPAGVPSVLGSGNIYGLRWMHPATPLNRYYHSVTFGIDNKDFEDLIDPNGIRLETPINYSNFSIDYSGSLSGELSEETGAPVSKTSLDISANMGIRGLGNSEGEFRRKSAFSRPDYFYTKIALEREQNLFYGLTGFARVEAQLTNEKLISNEQYSVGGADSVRGYLESSAQGDYGSLAQIELRSMPFVTEKTWGLTDGYGFIFYDFGQTRLNKNERVTSIGDANVGQRVETQLSSSGIGFKSSWFEGLSVSGVAARVNKTADPEQTQDAVKEGDLHFHFSVSYEF